MKNQFDELIQWTGTTFILGMYFAMNIFPESIQWVKGLGLGGSFCYCVWTFRVKNYPQMILNLVALTLCVIGLIKVWG